MVILTLVCGVQGFPQRCRKLQKVMTIRQIGTRGSDVAWPEGFQTYSVRCSQPQVRDKKRNQTVGGIRQLQEKIDQTQIEQAETVRHLQLLNDAHANL